MQNMYRYQDHMNITYDHINIISYYENRIR